jgi:hypothetical protein
MLYNVVDDVISPQSLWMEKIECFYAKIQT